MAPQQFAHGRGAADRASPIQVVGGVRAEPVPRSRSRRLMVLNVSSATGFAAVVLASEKLSQSGLAWAEAGDACCRAGRCLSGWIGG